MTQLKMSKKDDVSLNERNSMIINFDSLYVKLRDEYLYKNKEILKGWTQLELIHYLQNKRKGS